MSAPATTREVTREDAAKFMTVWRDHSIRTRASLAERFPERMGKYQYFNMIFFNPVTGERFHIEFGTELLDACVEALTDVPVAERGR